ncbi:MAG: RDD family protein [Polyangiaceae bacterium]
MAQPGYNPYAAPQGPEFPFASSTSDSMFIKAERGTRFAAKLIDGLCDVGAMLPGLAILFAGGAANEEALTVVGVLVMVAGLLGVAIYQWIGIVKSGQTVGKRMMKIKVVKQDGSAVDFVSGVVLRNWILAIAAQVVGAIGLVDALMIFTEQRRCLHDMLASTDVIVAESYAAF